MRQSPDPVPPLSDRNMGLGVAQEMRMWSLCAGRVLHAQGPQGLGYRPLSFERSSKQVRRAKMSLFRSCLLVDSV